MIITIPFKDFKDYVSTYFENEDNIPYDNFFGTCWLPLLKGNKWKIFPSHEIEIIENENYYEIHNPWYGEGFRYTRPTSDLTLPEYILSREKLKEKKEEEFDNFIAGLAATSISAVESNNSTGCSTSAAVNKYSDITPITVSTTAIKYADITTGNDLVITKSYADSHLSEVDAEINKTNDALKALEDCVNQYIDPLGKVNIKDEVIDFKNRKEENNMFNFDFGPCDKTNVKMSMYGFAIKDVNGNWVSFDKKAGNIVDVSNLTFGDGKYFYKMPVPIKDIKPGDLIIHEKRPMFVEDVDEKVGPIVVDVISAERKNILPPVSPFGFNFMTKIVSLMDMGGMSTEPSADNPFGNPMMFLLMNDDGFDKLDPMMMFTLMGGMGGNMKDMNPMMLAMMLSNK